MAGDLLLIVAVLAWAAYTAGGRDLVSRHGPVPTTAWSLIGGSLLYLPIGLVALAPAQSRAQIAHASAGAWLGVVYLAVGTSVLSYLLWYWALGHLAAARVAVFTNLQPLATAVLAHFALGEQITLEFVAGAVVVMAGVALAQTGRRGLPETPPEP
jgi:drug/metabolite transporter (DMT)-like permease